MELMRFQVDEEVIADRHPPAVWLPLLRATVWEPFDWLEFDAHNDIACHGAHYVIAGEASAHGSIGWVALVTGVDADTARLPPTEQQVLEWLLVSRYSNPFYEVDIDDTQVTATSTSGMCWNILRDKPQNATIRQLRH